MYTKSISDNLSELDNDPEKDKSELATTIDDLLKEYDQTDNSAEKSLLKISCLVKQKSQNDNSFLLEMNNGISMFLTQDAAYRHEHSQFYQPDLALRDTLKTTLKKINEQIVKRAEQDKSLRPVAVRIIGGKLKKELLASEKQLFRKNMTPA
ncbi:MAG: hypothetical protein GY821_01605 [Gammaproteobacteria bacterium]|nr:hypothetical protein [Gammaproteobacteria bacterium]